MYLHFLDQSPFSSKWPKQKEESLNSRPHFFIPEDLKSARSLQNGLLNSFENHLAEHWDLVAQEITHSLGCVLTVVITLHSLSEWAREKFSFQVQNPLHRSAQQCMSYCVEANLLRPAQKIVSRLIANQEKFTKMWVRDLASNHRRGELRMRNRCPSLFLSFRICMFVIVTKRDAAQPGQAPHTARQGTKSLKDTLTTNTNTGFPDGGPQLRADAEGRGPVLSEQVTPAPPWSAQAARLGAAGTRSALASAPSTPCPCRRAVAAAADWPRARGRARAAAGECERRRVSARLQWGTERPGAGRALPRVGGSGGREPGPIAYPLWAPLLPGGSRGPRGRRGACLGRGRRDRFCAALERKERYEWKAQFRGSRNRVPAFTHKVLLSSSDFRTP